MTVGCHSVAHVRWESVAAHAHNLTQADNNCFSDRESHEIPKFQSLLPRFIGALLLPPGSDEMRGSYQKDSCPGFSGRAHNKAPSWNPAVQQ